MLFLLPKVLSPFILRSHFLTSFGSNVSKVAPDHLSQIATPPSWCSLPPETCLILARSTCYCVTVCILVCLSVHCFALLLEGKCHENKVLSVVLLNTAVFPGTRTWWCLMHVFQRRKEEVNLLQSFRHLQKPQEQTLVSSNMYPLPLTASSPAPVPSGTAFSVEAWQVSLL